MKRTRKKALIIVAAVVAVVAMVALINIYPYFSMRPVETKQMPGTDILALNSKINNMFLLPTEEGYIAIDAGSDVGAVQAGLEQLGIDPAEIAYVLLTHSDYDHVAALALFENARVCMGMAEEQMVFGVSKTKRNFFSYNSLPQESVLAGITMLEDGKDLYIGGHMVRCVAAPGHTPGSVLYLVDGQYLFTGDAFQVSGSAMKLHPYTMDKEQALASLGIIKDMLPSIQLVLTAHYGFYAAGNLL